MALLYGRAGRLTALFGGFRRGQSWKLSLVMVAIIPLIVLAAGKFGKFVQKIQRQVQDALADATDVAEQALSGIRTVRSFSREGLEQARYKERVDESFRLGKKMAAGYGSFISLMFVLGNSAVSVILYAGGRLVLSGEMTVGGLTGFLLCPGPPLRGIEAALAFPTVKRLCVALLFGRAGRPPAKNGGFRPGQTSSSSRPRSASSPGSTATS
jgi:hypothetical protein